MLGHSEREARMCALAGRLEFAMQKAGEHFTVIGTADVTAPVRKSHLTLDQAEGLLEIWKLHGHG